MEQIQLLTEGAGAGSIGTAFSGIATQITAGIAEVAPYALGVMAALLIWRVGSKFFKTMAK